MDEDYLKRCVHIVTLISLSWASLFSYFLFWQKEKY